MPYFVLYTDDTTTVDPIRQTTVLQHPITGHKQSYCSCSPGVLCKSTVVPGTYCTWSLRRIPYCRTDGRVYLQLWIQDSGGSGILSLAGNKILLNLRRQERNFRNPQVQQHSAVQVLEQTESGYDITYN